MKKLLVFLISPILGCTKVYPKLDINLPDYMKKPAYEKFPQSPIKDIKPNTKTVLVSSETMKVMLKNLSLCEVSRRELLTILEVIDSESSNWELFELVPIIDKKTHQAITNVTFQPSKKLTKDEGLF